MPHASLAVTEPIPSESCPPHTRRQQAAASLNAVCQTRAARSTDAPCAVDRTSDIEQTALQRLAQGDQAAFWEIWQQYQDDVLFQCCLRWMNGNYADAEDALSMASLKAWKGLQGASGDVINIKSWLLRLLRNHCIDMRRGHERRARALRRVEPLDLIGSAQQDKETSVEEVVLRRELGQSILGAIDALPPRLREPARLRLVHDMPYRDIALQLNLTPANVRKRLQQARALLQMPLQSYLTVPAAGVPTAGRREP